MYFELSVKYIENIAVELQLRFSHTFLRCEENYLEYFAFQTIFESLCEIKNKI